MSMSKGVRRAYLRRKLRELDDDRLLRAVQEAPDPVRTHLLKLIADDRAKLQAELDALEAAIDPGR